MASGTYTPLNISRELSLKRTSIYHTLNSKYTTTLHEFLQPERAFIKKSFIGGGLAEGTCDRESDLDNMVVLLYTKVHTTVHTTHTNPESVSGFEFLLDTSDSNAGFGRLKLMGFYEWAHHFFSGYNINFLSMLQDGMYLSSDKFVDELRSVYRGGFAVPQRHGPCVAVEHQHVHRLLSGNYCKGCKTDYAFGLECDQWPVEAKEWITRERRHDWPPKCLIKTIKRQNCHVVPIGDARSPLSPLEWRISFMLGERELVWSFNNTQLQCYVLLKRLLKKFIERKAPGQLSSYHMKTIVFWLSEEKGLQMWTDANLLMCVTESLNMLKICIEKGELQHYFHRQRNLLNYKLEDVKQKERVLLKIAKIQENYATRVLRCIYDKDELLRILNFCNTRMIQLTEYLKTHWAVLNDGDLFTQAINAKNKLFLHGAIFLTLRSVTDIELDPLQISDMIKRLKENPPKGVLPTFIKMTKNYLHLQLGMTYFKDSRYWFDNKLTADDAFLGMKRAKFDSLSGVLYLASFKFSQEQFLAANDIILNVLRQNKNLTYHGRCSTYNNIELTEEGKTGQSLISFLVENPYMTYDVIFRYWDLLFVPDPVKFECALANYEYVKHILIHPCVYAYLLLCLGYYHLGDLEQFHDYLNHLKDTVNKTAGSFEHRYRALNFLGYCYYLDKNWTEAFRCFKESFRTTRNDSFVINAAAYHIGILILSVIDKTLYTPKSSREHTETIYTRKNSREHTRV